LDHLIEIDGLTVSFKTDEGVFNAVEEVSFNIGYGEIVGIVGESGCGKSVTALSIIRLIPTPPGSIDHGRVVYKGRNLLELKRNELRDIRGRSISMIFQEPLSALSPLQKIGQQMAEVLRLHTKISRREAWRISGEWLEKVKIPDAAERLFAYPYQLSGGMQQRIMIAMALMQSPDLIIADEPTTALDVTIQAQVFQLIKAVKQENTSILLITHDMGVVWDMCDRVVVMYAARVVETGRVADIFSNPAHPYTRGLLNSIPRLGDGSGARLAAIAGNVPSPFKYSSGCRFRDRCPLAFERCAQAVPPFKKISEGHRAACFRTDRVQGFEGSRGRGEK
jgi:peptide/nickel transport system ATP-binding protein/oligopeptide transport system ATP-binding protein